MGTPPSRATLLKLLNPSKSIRLLRLQKCLQLPYGRQPASLGPALLPAIPVTLAFRWMGSLLLFLMGFPKGSRWKRTNLPSPWCPLPVSTEGNSCSVLGIRCVLLRGFYSPPLWAATIVCHLFAAERTGPCEEQMRTSGAVELCLRLCRRPVVG